jgi:hypothetical protein
MILWSFSHSWFFNFFELTSLSRVGLFVGKMVSTPLFVLSRACRSLMRFWAGGAQNGVSTRPFASKRPFLHKHATLRVDTTLAISLPCRDSCWCVWALWAHIGHFIMLVPSAGACDLWALVGAFVWAVAALALGREKNLFRRLALPVLVWQ